MQENNITTTVINTNGKMKKLGWICISFAMVLSILVLIPPLQVPTDIALPLIYFWAGTGITLLFGNAGKHLVGNSILQKAQKGVQ